MDDLERKILNKSIEYINLLRKKSLDANNEFLQAQVELQQICKHETILEHYNPETWCNNAFVIRVCADCRLYYHSAITCSHVFASLPHNKCVKVNDPDEIFKIRDWKE